MEEENKKFFPKINKKYQIFYMKRKEILVGEKY